MHRVDTDSVQLLWAERERELVAQHRHQRLQAVQQREGGKAAVQHGFVDAPEGEAGGSGWLGHGAFLEEVSAILGLRINTVQYIFVEHLI
ncbi:hypothetical protein LP419_08895 [Massilia sp. H-1]|nr:hypothetical protein LP419_08895 [Massilia sp. H-1]